MREFEMKAVYTVAAVPLQAKPGKREPNVVPLTVRMPYTLADAEIIASNYNANPAYRAILQRYKYSHFVPFNLEALTMDPPPYYMEAGHA